MANLIKKCTLVGVRTGAESLLRAWSVMLVCLNCLSAVTRWGISLPSSYLAFICSCVVMPGLQRPWKTKDFHSFYLSTNFFLLPCLAACSRIVPQLCFFFFNYYSTAVCFCMYTEYYQVRSSYLPSQTALFLKHLAIGFRVISHMQCSVYLNRPLVR